MNELISAAIAAEQPRQASRLVLAERIAECIFAAAVIALLYVLLFPKAHADELNLEFAVGQTYFKRIHRDNYWYQGPFPYEHDLTDAAWRLGISKKLGKWSYGLAYLDLGTIKVKSEAIPSDPAYFRCMDGDTSTNGCGYPTTWFRVTDRVRGLEFNAMREFDPLYVRGGLMIWHHKLHALNGVHESCRCGEFRGQAAFLAPFVGVGASYGPLFAEISYYHSLGDGAFPIAKRAIVPMIGIRLKLK